MSQIFALDTPESVLAVLRDGIDLFRRNTESRFLVLTVPGIAWAIVDWVWLHHLCRNVTLQTKLGLSLSSRDVKQKGHPASVRAFFVKNPSLAACREITTFLKHGESQLIQQNIRHTQEMSGGIGGFGPFGGGPFGAGPTQFTIVDKSGKDRPALEVYEDAYAFWLDFFQRYLR